ncbi:hypothetical protein BHYA_0015g00180 [Botrytis hyacinthi]|uniref:Uncharacterized protein n=1 Tax=Botrytis hyacinthi TaxID=278943 RepID=A0A4Z1GZ79_9HELO|nr:hypothetical protein BHYA_0015g00180 [Botrytis hyacinthi]
MNSLKKEDERSEVIERSSESKVLPSIPSIYSAPYPPYLSAFYSRFYTPPPPLPFFPPHFPFSPTSYYSSSPKISNTWKIIRICGVEDIKSKEWTHEIETEKLDDNNAIEHPEDVWSERRQNFATREGEWIPMAWIPKPVRNVDVSAIPDTGPQGTAGEDSNGYGYRGRILGQSRLPGMMSELDAYLQNERAENGNWESRTDMRERIRERGLRWE